MSTKKESAAVRKANIDRMERLGLPRPMARELVDAYHDGDDWYWTDESCLIRIGELEDDLAECGEHEIGRFDSSTGNPYNIGVDGLPCPIWPRLAEQIRGCQASRIELELERRGVDCEIAEMIGQVVSDDVPLVQYCGGEWVVAEGRVDRLAEILVGAVKRLRKES